ncbi:MAG: sigma-70 family RNA polymerase sigma factor [Bacteroidales bacterium]|jgi:RNA polymerase sigma-70 factor (ECF subfamily)|nr:sigma-70 family RNA polymerase sigma factor [Bacteroidales bacterium]
MSTQEFNNRLMSYENSLSYFALSLTRDSETAKDLVQDTYLKAIQYRDKYTSDNNIKAWLFTILRNTYLNQVTRLSYKNTIKDESEDSYIIKNTLPENQNAESVINTNDISLEIDTLEDEYRIPFRMFLDGYKYKEIAEETNLPIGTVKSRIFFARKILMERLQDFV